jgi:hypothetical protein
MSQHKNGDGLSFQFRKAESPVLIEGLGDGARQYEKRNRPFSPDRQIRIRQKRRFLPLLADLF